MPTSATHRPTCSGVSWRLTPSVSTTSAEPHSEAPLNPDIDRLPCLATLRPAPATTNAVAVETLNVPVASPPVPQVSISISRSVPLSPATSSPRARMRTTFWRITCAKPISSSTVSPFMRRAVRNAAICALVAAPDMIASIAAAASIRVRSRRSTRTRIASVMIGLVMPAPPSPSRAGPPRVPYPCIGEDPHDLTPLSFRQDQLAGLRDAQPVFLPVMDDDQLSVELEERHALDPARRPRRRLSARRLHRGPRLQSFPDFGLPSLPC